MRPMDRNLLVILNLHCVPTSPISSITSERCPEDNVFRLKLTFNDDSPDVFMDEDRAINLANRLRRGGFYEPADRFEAGAEKVRQHRERRNKRNILSASR